MKEERIKKAFEYLRAVQVSNLTDLKGLDSTTTIKRLELDRILLEFEIHISSLRDFNKEMVLSDARNKSTISQLLNKTKLLEIEYDKAIERLTGK